MNGIWNIYTLKINCISAQVPCRVKAHFYFYLPPYKTIKGQLELFYHISNSHTPIPIYISPFTAPCHAQAPCPSPMHYRSPMICLALCPVICPVPVLCPGTGQCPVPATFSAPQSSQWLRVVHWVELSKTLFI